MKNTIIIGTRKSKLARLQAEYIGNALKEFHPELTIEFQPIMTKGDKILDVSLAKIGGKGLFTKELERKITNGTIDLAVHSLKDVPMNLPVGLTLAAILKRTDPSDVLVCPRYGTLEQLPTGATIGTSSLRRGAQLLHYRPDLRIITLRGNVDTRLQKLDDGEFDAIVVAASGLKRLGLENRVTQVLPFSICLPAIGQGALAVETRAGDNEILALTKCLDDAATRCAVTAERSFLRRIEGGCQIPVGVYGETEPDNVLSLEALISTTDGRTLYRRQLKGTHENSAALGTQLAEQLLADGGKKILQDLGLLEDTTGRNMP